MAVSPDQALTTLRSRWEHSAAFDQRAAEEAMASLPSLVQWLVVRGAAEVVLFGSLAEGRFRRSSDIDLAVRGLSARELARAASALSELASRRVELVALEDVGPGLAIRIAQLGKRLH